jgi:hypothetical protein
MTLKSSFNTFYKTLFTVAVCIGVAQAQPVELANGSFENDMEGWGQRSQTASVYKIESPGHEGEKYARLQVTADDPQRDREAVYFNRRDLPTEEGYYLLSFAARTDLQQGKGGALVVTFDDKSQVLKAYAPGGFGVPMVTGQTPWTEYSFVFAVPPQTKMTVLQLNGDGMLGTVDYDAVQIEKVSEAQGKKMMAEQKAKFVIPPFQAKPPRTPQFPLKTERMIVTEADLAVARDNIEKYPEAKKVLEAVQKIADPWLEWSDEDLRKLLTSARVTRAFDLNVNGCPVHGREIFNVGGTYPWKLDPKQPLKVTCPIGNEVYPSNDYEAYANSGFDPALKKSWSGPYVDDGFGWVDPKNGERYWFVAYANQWNWYRTISPAITNLSRAYLLTGDKRYAHKAAVMLVRLAQVYPEMDYTNQSRYGLMRKAEGGTYPGKVLNHIWETFFARDAAEAYDNIWNSIDGDAELQKLYGKTGPELRGFVEANFLEDAIDAYFAKKIQGNFGMHQNALLNILLARQNVDLKKYFRLLVDEPGDDVPHTGLRYALYNQVWRDGTPFESPGYNFSWIANFSDLAVLLKKGDYDLFADPKMKLLFDSPLDIVNIGLHTPAWGDSSSVMGGLVGRSTSVYAPAQRAYNDPRYARWMAGAGENDNRGFTTFETLFNPPLPQKTVAADNRAVPPQPSRLLAGYGVGILNNPADTVSLTLTYSQHISHYHWDFLNFELFANGLPMMPDLGYPDAMNAYVPSIFTWSNNTIAHNTVVVNEKKQDNNLPGVLHEFVASPFARSADASSPAYNEASEYRRHLIQVDADAQQSYVVDVFRVTGGTQHDYSLHGPPGQVEAVGGNWSTPAKGTLAGPDVEYGEIYDNAALAEKDYKGSYGGYRGSGFQHLLAPQKLQSGAADLRYRHSKDADAQLIIHSLTAQVGQAGGAPEVFMADAYDKPRSRNNTLKYLITRRKSAGDAPLESTFVSVFEPFRGEPFIRSAQVVKLQSGQGIAVRVQRATASDIVISDPAQSRKVLPDYKLETDAKSAVVTLDANNNPTRVFFSGGTFLKCGDQSFSAAPIVGKVAALDAMAQNVSVALPAGSTPDASALSGRVAHFSNAAHETVHPIQSASREGDTLTLKTADAILVGRARVKKAEDAAVTTDTALAFAKTYGGTYLLSDKFSQLALVKSVDAGEIALSAPPSQPLVAGSDVWFSNIGVGDAVEFPTVFSWIK